MREKKILFAHLSHRQHRGGIAVPSGASKQNRGSSPAVAQWMSSSTPSSSSNAISFGMPFLYAKFNFQLIYYNVFDHLFSDLHCPCCHALASHIDIHPLVTSIELFDLERNGNEEKKKNENPTEQVTPFFTCENHCYAVAVAVVVLSSIGSKMVFRINIIDYSIDFDL